MDGYNVNNCPPHLCLCPQMFPCPPTCLRRSGASMCCERLTKMQNLLWLSSKVTVAVCRDASYSRHLTGPPSHLRRLSRNMNRVSFLVPGGMLDSSTDPDAGLSWASAGGLSSLVTCDTDNTLPLKKSIWPRRSMLSATVCTTHNSNFNSQWEGNDNSSCSTLYHRQKYTIIKHGATITIIIL